MDRIVRDKCVVYLGETFLGELESVPNPNPNPNPNTVKDSNFKFPNNEIRIHYISPLSERCPPLSILQTISFSSVRCKLEPSSNSPIEHPHLINLHASCFHESKTAVVVLGDEEIHLVAMPSKQKKFPCFWCYSVPCGLYVSCLGMLNLRCLAIVFDLDETLLVANTMKSFEDRIDILRSWLVRETDPVRLAGMSAELKRYMDDRALLKQYADGDCVVDNTNGMMLKVKVEEVAPVSDGQGRLIRPVIRLPDRNIVLTRIDPEIRDTSVLVRLRPAWEDLRSYLTAKGRKRFEVYVCTMAERDYALEMWRLLDPEAHLIGQKQLNDRVVCVKSGSRKSLLNVFQCGVCHPKMAMVIDDRSKVWEDKDQPRVHVVPPFTPYYAPQAETANAVPVLCVARNVACNVRGGFFKEFDEILLRRISELFYEDEVINLPPAPDVSNYLLSEDTGFVANGNGAAPIAEGMRGAEVERMMHPSIYLDDKSNLNSASHFIPNVPELRAEISQPPPQAAFLNVIAPTIPRATLPSQKGLLGAPIRRDSGVSESDADMRKRPFTKHGLDIRNPNSGDPPILSRVPGQVPWSSVQSQGGWLVEEEISRGQSNNRASVISLESDSLKLDKPLPHQNALHSTCDASTSGLPSQVSQGHPGNEWQRQNFPPTNPSSDVLVVADGAASQSQTSYSTRELQTEVGKVNGSTSSLSIGVLQEIGRRCCTKVEFRSVVSTSEDLQFSVEVLFTGERIGAGMGKTRRDAHQQAAENALRSLADKYVEYFAPRSGTVNRDFDKLSLRNDNGFVCDVVNAGSVEISTADGLHTESSSKTASLLQGSAS